MNKLSNTYRLFFSFLLGLLFLGTAESSAQQTGCFDLPYLRFLSPTLVSGTAGQLNAQYRFNNVVSGVDALVTIVGRQNANLTTIDQNNQGGTDEAFQPQIGLANVSSGEGFYDFRIQFVEAGTNTPTSIDDFAVTALDVDGDNNSTREFVGFKAGESYTIEGTSNLTPSYVSPYNIFEAATSNQIPGIDPEDTNNLVYLRYGRNTSFQFRAGVKNPSNTTGRLFSFDFNSCISNNFNNPQTTTVDADVSINKAVNNASPTAGENIRYTLNVTNGGPRTATGIVVQDVMPQGVSFVSATAGQGSYTNNSGNWTVGDLNSGSSTTLIIQARVKQGTGGSTITNTAQITRLNQNDPNTTNNSNNAVINVKGGTPAPSGVQQCTEFTGIWSGSGNTWTSTTSSGIGVAISLQAEAGAEWNSIANGTMNTIDAWSEPGVQGSPSFQANFFWDTTDEATDAPASDDAANGTLTVTFDRPVFNPVLHIDRIGGEGGGQPNSSEWTSVTAGASITRLAGVDHFVTEPQRFYRSLTGTTSGGQSSLNGNSGSAAGSVLFEGVFTELAFNLTGIGTEGIGGDGLELVMCGHSRDFGDLPAPYASTLADGGPSHQITGGASSHYLGTVPDAENDAQPAAGADGDNTDNTADEDGITISQLIQGGSSTITADVTGDDGYLQGWIDWNSDGDFDDTVDGESERIATDLQDGDNDGSIDIPVNVPATATTDQTYARFRWSTVQGLKETNHARDGEVEDYALTVSDQGTISVSGTVYTDGNHNGVKESAEDGISGVTIVLHNTGTNSCQSIATGADGEYAFAGVADGDYEIIEAAGESRPAPGVCPPPEADPAGYVSTTGNTIEITVTGAPITEKNFGNFNGSKLTGIVFQDDGQGGGTANDGVQNGEEVGVPKTVLRLTDDSGNIVYGTAKTKGDGRYTLWISDALSGSPLRVIETNFDNYVSTGGNAGTTGGSYDRAADAVTFTPASGTAYSGVNFGDVPANKFNTDGKQNTAAGTTVYFSHKFTAQSDGTVTALTVTDNISSGADAWAKVIYYDFNCNGRVDDGEAPVQTPADFFAGEFVCGLVKVTVPAGTPAGTTNSMKVGLSFDYTNADPALTRTYSRTDLVTVTDGASGGLKITKDVDREQALPGETLTYTITYTNNGSQPLNNLEIFDSTPAYTGFTSASCNAPLSDNLGGCMINDPGAGQTGAVTWTFEGSLAPGRSGTVTYQVTILN